MKDLIFQIYTNETVGFTKFYRNNITDMSGMFYKYSSLKEIKTSKVFNMSLHGFDNFSLNHEEIGNHKVGKLII